MNRRDRPVGRLADPALRKTLRETFGVTSLRPGQAEVMESVLAGRDTLALMPTGSGKSLCYQVPALGTSGLTLVVSPLISLMKDQADKLDEAGVRAAQLNSTLNMQEEQAALQSIRRAREDIVFATPEKLADPEFIDHLRKTPLSLLVVDEAHCISTWGHDFRPAYLEIGRVIRELGHPTVLALTATATQEVIDDIRCQLGLPDMRVVNTGVYRENLRYGVVHAAGEDDKLAQLGEQLGRLQGSGIVYTATVKAAEKVHQAMREAGLDVLLYHGRLPARVRNENQDHFMRGEARVMIATNAFGMGIDKPDIRFVIHFQMPGKLEAYYQESGRAGRDGGDADCILIYSIEDKRVQLFFLAHHYPDAKELESIHDVLRGLSRDRPADMGVLGAALPGMSKSNLQVALKLMTEAGLAVREREGHRAMGLPKRRDFAALAAVYAQKNAHDRQALERMVFYAQSGLCRWKMLLEYFGEEAGWEHCGNCDNCLHPPEIEAPAVQRQGGDNGDVEEDELAPGHAVVAAKYGEGQVIEVAGDKVTVAFPNSVKKTFLRGYLRPA